jgi:hypothetical protein
MGSLSPESTQREATKELIWATVHFDVFPFPGCVQSHTLRSAGAGLWGQE